MGLIQILRNLSGRFNTNSQKLFRLLIGFPVSLGFLVSFGFPVSISLGFPMSISKC